ncbi:MAG: type II secretion system F family protein [Lachnospiraceae bacterium]|nr:type II secretion system F family protein [Lachnospiraceae bacterium]
MDSGVDISKAVQMLADEESGVLKDKLNKAAASVRGGNSLSDAFRQQNLPAEIINRIRVGETSGELDKMLEQTAAGYRLG